MPLSDDEKRTLEALQRKAKEPEQQYPNANLSVSIDLADEAQVVRGQRLGLLRPFASDGDGGDGGDGGGDGGGGDGGGGGEETPRRKGFFGE